MKGLFLLLTLLTACVEESVTPPLWRKAEELCAPNKGVEFVRRGDSGATVGCVNRARFYLTDSNWLENP